MKIAATPSSTGSACVTRELHDLSPCAHEGMDFCSLHCVCSVGCGGGCWYLQGSVPGTGAQLSCPRAAVLRVPRSCSRRCHSWERALKSIRRPCAGVLLQTGAAIGPCRATCGLWNPLRWAQVVMSLYKVGSFVLREVFPGLVTQASQPGLNPSAHFAHA